MGCQCVNKCGKDNGDNEKQFDVKSTEQNINSNNSINKNSLRINDFKLYSPNNNIDLQYITRNLSFSLYELINKIRTNPKSFIDLIKEWKDKIIMKENKYLLPISKEVFITLNKGPIAFDECINYLNELDNINALIMKDELNVDIIGNIKENCEESNYTSFSFLEKIIKLKKKELEQNKKYYKITAFHYDKSCDNPEISLLLQIVDDNVGDCTRRKNLLNPNFNYIGISCVNIKENIFCYYCLFANKKNK